MLDYKDYVKYWYKHGFKGYEDSKDFCERFKKRCILTAAFDKYRYSDENLRHDLSHYKTSICILVGVLSRMKNEDKLLNY